MRCALHQIKSLRWPLLFHYYEKERIPYHVPFPAVELYASRNSQMLRRPIAQDLTSDEARVVHKFTKGVHSDLSLRLQFFFTGHRYIPHRVTMRLFVHENVL